MLYFDSIIAVSPNCRPINVENTTHQPTSWSRKGNTMERRQHNIVLRNGPVLIFAFQSYIKPIVWQVSLQAVTKFCKINSSLNIPASCAQQPTHRKVGQGLPDVTRWVGFILFRVRLSASNSLRLSLRPSISTPIGIQFTVYRLGNDLESLASYHLGHH